MKTKRALCSGDKQAIKDAVWWRMVASIIGCKLHGFNYRDSASFFIPSGLGTVEIPGWLASKLVALQEAASHE